MAITTKTSNYFKEQLLAGTINFGSMGVNQGDPHTFKLMLMASPFVFDEENHSFLTDVTSQALAEVNGYSKVTINPLTVERDIALDKIVVSWGTIKWDITGDGIRTVGAIIYDDIPDPYDERIIIGCISFGEEKVIYNEGVFTISNGKLILL